MGIIENLVCSFNSMSYILFGNEVHLLCLWIQFHYLDSSFMTDLSRPKQIIQFVLRLIPIIFNRCYHQGLMLVCIVELRIGRREKKTETGEIVKLTTIQIIKQKNTGTQLLLYDHLFILLSYYDLIKQILINLKMMFYKHHRSFTISTHSMIFKIRYLKI